MRRRHNEVTDPQEIRRILNATTIGRLGTNSMDGHPYITPVSFVYLDDCIYFHCATSGEKLENIERDPRVCFEVDIPLAYFEASFDPERRACKLHQFYHCVIIRGHASIIPNGPLKTAALNALIVQHEGEGTCVPVTEDSPTYGSCHVVRITPSSLTAKSDLGQNRTHQERLSLARSLKRRNAPMDPATMRAMGFNPDDLPPN